MVTQGGFRQDLLFRLCTMTIQLPPLRTRLEDLGDLVKYFLTSLCGRYGLATKSLTPEFIMALGDYDWPGNVRELMNILEQTVLRAQPEPLLFPNHLPPHLRIHAARQAITKKPPVTGATLPSPPYQFPSFRASIRQAIADAEQRYLADLIAYTQGDVKLACKIAQLSKTRMYELLKKFQLPKDSVIATNTEQSLHLRTSHLPLGNGFSI
jgi:two-component system NtrC family response regulator